MRIIGVAFAACLSLVLVGCAPPPWIEDGNAEPTVFSALAAFQPADEEDEDEEIPAPEPTEEPEEEEEPEPPVVPLSEVANDLATGSATRTLNIGPAALELRYWSDLNLDSWTASASKPLTIRATGSSSGSLELTSLRASADALVGEVWEGTGRNTLTLPQSPLNADIHDPQASIQTVLIGSLPDEARGVRLTFVYDIVVDDGYTRGVYSGSDTLTLPLSKP